MFEGDIKLKGSDSAMGKQKQKEECSRQKEQQVQRSEMTEGFGIFED